MILGTKQSDAELTALMPSINSDMYEWQIITIMLEKSCMLSQGEVLKKLLEAYGDYDGVIYPVNKQKIICLVRFGAVSNYATFKLDIEKTLPERSCRVLARKMSPAGLKQIQGDLGDEQDNAGPSLFDQREGRSNNVLMVADDDMFVRKAMKNVLGAYGEVVEVDNGDSVVPEYLEHNPDVIFLDIHMPGKGGLELIEALFEVDPDTFILIFSADSIKENVLSAIEQGAIGFISKPPNKEKISEYLNQCITIQ